MYRIELSPGEETVFRSIEELAVAIKRGVVTPRARIYHNASSKWLPIQFHPHYKTALTMPLTQSALVAGPPVKTLSSLTLSSGSSNSGLSSSEPLPERPQATAPALAPAAVPSSEPLPKHPPTKAKSRNAKRPGRKGKQQRQLRIALVGALLLGGAQWVLSEPLFNRPDVAALFRTHRQFLPAPANTAAMLSAVSTPEHPSAALFGGRSAAPGDSEPAIEPAPGTEELVGPQVPRPDSLPRLPADSAGEKAIKGILRALSGTSGASAGPKR